MSMKPLVATVAVVAALGVGGWIAFRTGAESAASLDNDRETAARAPVSSTAPAPVGTPTVAGARAGPPTVRPDANANVASVAEAVRTGKFPERLSPMIAPKPFDHAAFAANPQAFLDVVEPGRSFQTAEPGVDVPVLSPKGSASFKIPVGGACTLMVITRPGYPVTFTGLDLGTFVNSLTSITVQADDQGVASAVYSASGGVIADAQVLAGSPGASGQVKFHIFVTDPQASVAK